MLLRTPKVDIYQYLGIHTGPTSQLLLAPYIQVLLAGHADQRLYAESSPTFDLSQIRKVETSVR